MSDFGSGGLWWLIVGAFVIAIPFVGFWNCVLGLIGACIIGGFALGGANNMYHPNGDRRPYHPKRNPHGPRREKK